MLLPILFLFKTKISDYFKYSKLVNDGIIVNDIFEKDYEFNAPSAASAVILGRTSNGNIDWRSETGTSLKDIS